MKLTDPDSVIEGTFIKHYEHEKSLIKDMTLEQLAERRKNLRLIADEATARLLADSSNVKEM